MKVQRAEVGIVVCTYGDEKWSRLAQERALPTAENQDYRLRDGTHIVPFSAHTHLPHGTLAQARNQAITHLRTGFVIVLDGDDELAPGYVKAMLSARPSPDELLVPAISYVRRGRRQAPKFWREVPYEEGNWLPIGTMFSREAFYEAGGFEEWPMYEDWALFARMQKLGCRPRKVADAVYVAHRPERGRLSRNHFGGRRKMQEAHNAIRRAVFPELYEEGAMVEAVRGYDS